MLMIRYSSEIHSHMNNKTYWATGDYQQWMKEVDQERDILNFYGNIPKDKIQVAYIYQIIYFKR